MDIQACLIKLGYKAVVWNNSYDGIVPHKLETRSVPSLKDLESVWPGVQAEMEKNETNAVAKKNLEAIDLKSIRALREWVSKQPDVSPYVVDCENEAKTERAKLQL